MRTSRFPRNEHRDVVVHVSSISCWATFVADFGGQSAHAVAQSGGTQGVAHAHARFACQWQQGDARGWPSRRRHETAWSSGNTAIPDTSVRIREFPTSRRPVRRPPCEIGKRFANSLEPEIPVGERGNVVEQSLTDQVGVTDEQVRGAIQERPPDCTSPVHRASSGRWDGFKRRR